MQSSRIVGQIVLIPNLISRKKSFAVNSGLILVFRNSFFIYLSSLIN